MKHKFSSMGRVAIALVLALSLSLVMAVPVSATHTSSATVEFHAGESQLVGEASVLDVEVTNDPASLGKINEVKIDFSATAFTSIGKGVDPANWTGVVEDSVITYTAAAGAEIAADASLTFYPTVTNPEEPGVVDPNPTVTTSDPGNKAVLTTGAQGTDEISYVAVDAGAGGNAITIEYVDPGLASQPLDVSVDGKAITVSLETDVGLACVSTAPQVVAAINADAEASLLVDASTSDGGDVAVGGPFSLADGEPEVDKTCGVTGTLTILEFAVTAVPGVFTSGTATTYTVSFTTLTEIVATTGTITITFPSGYDISLLEEADIVVTAYTPLDKAIDAVARSVTITANAVIVADTAVEVTINDHVKNPPTSGTYDIAVLTSGPDEGSGEVTIVPFSFGVVAGVDDTVTAGTAFAVTVTALNEDEDTDTGYAGSHFIDFVSTGTGTSPAFELFSFADGVGTSPQSFIRTVADEAAVTIRATDEDGLTGISAEITINPATLASFTISGEAGVVAGVAFASDITVTAKDAYGDGNVKTDYVGTVTWTSTDEFAVLPADYTFTSEDAGVAVFPGSEFILKTVGEGTQTITVADEAAGVEQESGPIAVTAAAATDLEVAASVGVLRANDAIDNSTITVTALDEFGNTDETYAGVITIESSLGTIANASPGFAQGEATTTLTSILDEVGTATIRVTGDFDPVTTTVKLLPLIGIDSIEGTVDKTTILNNGADECIITATYLDSDSKVVAPADGADYKVTFSITTGEGTLSETEVDPVAGVATTTLTTTLATGTIVVTATGTGVSGTSPDITVEVGTKDIDLSQGWNLISLPLIPVDESIETVLAGLIDAGTVIQVQTYNTSSGNWSKWASTGPYALNPTLTEMEDGPGFWVEMSATGTLTATGYVLPTPPETPPTYSVYTGWNMIGFTSLDAATQAQDYLGLAVMLTFEAMYGYDATTGLYEVVAPAAPPLVPGQGYWVAVNANGTIYP